VWAAARGRADAVALLAELGFDVNARGRGDVPVESTWETALHHAAGDGNVELVRLLISLGADVSARDERFNATPQDWALHFDQQETAELLVHAALPPLG
jgi:ankyrin repeat protein